MAVCTLVHAQVEFMAEFNLAAIIFESYNAWFEAFVAFITIGCGCKSIFAIVAGAAIFAVIQIRHGEVLCSCFVGEQFGVAFLAAEYAGVDRMPENCRLNSLALEADLFRFHTLVAVAAVAGYSEGFGPVVTSAASLSLFHLRHGYPGVFAGNDFAVVAAFAFTADFNNVDRKSVV